MGKNEGFHVNKKYLVFPVLLVLLSAFLVIGFVNQTDQTQRKETIKELVIEATRLIEDNGEGAFSEFRQEGTKWFHDDTYVFVWMTNGIRVVYPPNPSGEGQNMSTLLDVTGKAIGRLFIDIALSEEGEGWIDYSWPKPEETEPSSKQTYIKGVTVDEQTFLVGAGIYLDTNENVMKPLQYLSIIMESVIAATGLFMAVRKKRVFGYGIFLTFVIYVVYDLVNLLQLEVSDFTLYPMFFVATLSILWATLLMYTEK
jgi:signal transduction histidine kinase